MKITLAVISMNPARKTLMQSQSIRLRLCFGSCSCTSDGYMLMIVALVRIFSLVMRLLLRSLKAIRKEATIVAVILGRSTPDPGVGAVVKLSGHDARGLLDLISVGKTLSSQRIATEEAPLAFLEVQPARSFGNEHVVETRMLSHPGLSLSAVVAGKVVRDDEDVARGIVGFDVGKQSDVVGRVARSSASGEPLAIAHTQRAIHPGLLRPATVVQHCFDAVPSGGPAGCGREGARHYLPSSSVQMVVDPSGGSV